MNIFLIIVAVIVGVFILLNPILLVATVGLIIALLFIDKGAGGNAGEQIYEKVRDWLKSQGIGE